MYRSERVHMIQFWLNTKNLVALGRMLHLPLKIVNINYLVHCALSELFQKEAPKPFSVEDTHREGFVSNGQSIRILCYSVLDWENLHEIAQRNASPTVYEIVEWGRTASKPMPKMFSEGEEYKFELRTSPVIRKASHSEKWNKGQEIDIFLSKVWELNDEKEKIDRGTVYKEWLDEHFKRKNCADLCEIKIKRFSIERMSRRNHKQQRKMSIIQRPDVTFNGRLKITDPDNFKNLLYQGIGRHKSFGYGMLKLRKR